MRSAAAMCQLVLPAKGFHVLAAALPLRMWFDPLLCRLSLQETLD